MMRISAINAFILKKCEVYELICLPNIIKCKIVVLTLLATAFNKNSEIIQIWYYCFIFNE